MPQKRTSKWFPFKNDNVELAPETTGVYELGYKEVVVYIGSAITSIKDRLRTHKKQTRFAKVTNFRFKLLNWKSEAREEEHRLTEAFKKKNDGKLPRLQRRGVNKPSLW